MSVKVSLKGFRPIRKVKEKSEYDVVIVGGGVAGVTAGIYCARYALDTLIITGSRGGQLTEAGYVENYPGFTSILGPELANRMYEHLEKYEVTVVLDFVTDIEKLDNGKFLVRTRRGNEYVAKAIILAVGVVKRKLNVPGEKEFAGRGVSYCAPCDAPLFKGKVVAVVGGGDSAANAALLISEYASKVYVIHRRSKFRAEPIYVKRMVENPKIEFILNAQVKEICGDKTVEYVILHNGEKVKVDGVFIEIGADPPVEFLKKVGVALDEEGYIRVNPDQSTSIPGIFAAGDCTTASTKFKQIATAVGEGAIAANSVREYILKTFATERPSG